MPNSVVELYAPERLEKLDRRRKTVKLLLLLLVLAALGVCIFFTARVTTRNYTQMLLRCICVSVATAWIVIYFGIYVVRDGRRELEHARHLAEGQRETVTGTVTVEKLKVHVRNSITLRKVRVDTEDGPVSLSVHIDKADQLKRAGKRLTLYTVHGYVVAYRQAEGGEAHEDS